MRSSGVDGLIRVWLAIFMLARCHGSPAGERVKKAAVFDETLNYLAQYGYLSESDSEAGNLRSEDQLQEAIKNLQAFGNIPVTGVLDEATARLIHRPRCGLPDVQSSDNVRRKRYTLHGQRWDHVNLTWSLRSYRVPNLDYYAVKDALEKALNLWAKHSKLTFKHVNSDRADILIFFERQQHGDGYPFDGRGRVLAHAFFPGPDRGGDAHFDEEEDWSTDERMDRSKGTSLFGVAAHEFGHSLGLSHSYVQGSLMFPWYQGVKENFDLPDDDREAIQILYGPREDRRPIERPRMPTYSVPKYSPYVPPVTFAPKVPKWTNTDKAPNTCDTSYDAVSMIRGEMFVFKDEYVWRIGDNGVYRDYPTKINRLWSELPNNFTHVDAVYERYDKKIVFFIGREVYMYQGVTLMHGFPKPLTALGLPSSLDRIDAAMVWGYNSKTYFFSGNLYWRFDEEVQRVELDYPRNMSIWKGIGGNIDAAFQWKDGATYFFKGKNFWKFNDPKLRVHKKTPSSSAEFWMRCPKSADNMSESLKEKPNDFAYDIAENFFITYQNVILIGSIVIAVILMMSVILIVIKRRHSHSYIRPQRIKR